MRDAVAVLGMWTRNQQVIANKQTIKRQVTQHRELVQCETLSIDIE